VEHFSTEELNHLVHIICESCGQQLTKRAFTEITFELFEDISGMEGESTSASMEIINTLWKKYRD
jgi:hypothetical protein